MILITGATGTVGRELVKQLVDDGEKVAAVTRNQATAALPDEADVVVGDPSEPSSLTPALSGVDAIFLNLGAVGDATAQLLSLAAEHGVERAVLPSSLTVEHGGGEGRFADAFKTAEDTVQASGLQWTFLRSADFAANTRAWAPQIRLTGVVRAAYGDAATSPIHERDIAAVGARALVDAVHAGHAYVLTGPQSLTQRSKVHLIGDAIDKQLSWEEIPPEQVREAVIAQGYPEHIPDRMLGYQADCVKQPGPTSDTVAQLLGRPPLTFAEWAADHAATFRSRGARRRRA